MSLRIETPFGWFPHLVKKIWQPLLQPSEDSLKPLQKISDTVYTGLEKGITRGVEIMMKQVVASFELKPEREDYYQRLILRSLVGLPHISPSDEKSTAINELSGSISWIVNRKINVTKFLREVRNGE